LPKLLNTNVAIRRAVYALGPLTPQTPITESTFHIMEFALNFPDAVFPFAENAFRIAKFITYLFEK